VIGPNPIFLRYIAQVLPSLGETAVRQTTLERLLGGRVRAFDAPPSALVKGDLRMATVLARACAQQVRLPSEDIAITTAWGQLRLSADDVRAAVDVITARGVPFNVGRGALRTQLQRLAYQQHVERRDHPALEDDFLTDLRANGLLQAAVARVWPTVSATALVRRLLTNRRALSAAADGVLDVDEQALLLRKAVKRLDDEPWTLADLVLVDEADGLVTGLPRTYGHVVVDEAQDLTAMELRVLARRCPTRSMTILGDLAQATAVGAQSSWTAAVHAFEGGQSVQLEELELGYRVPAPIIDFANRLLPIAAPHVRPSRSVRIAGEPPSIVPTHADEMGAAVATEVASRAARWSSVGIVVPDALLDAVARGLQDAGVAFGAGLRVGLDETVTLLPPPAAKGLEFDVVVVVEPAAFADDGSTRGARLLYVALTRAVQELVVVHARPLPEPLLQG
jgi:DNA helicase IV